MRRIDEHLAAYVTADPDSLVFTASRGGPLFRSTFARRVWKQLWLGLGSTDSPSMASGTAL